MRAYSNMTTAEFVAQLRDIAIKAGACALVIDKIDAILENTEEDIEEAGEEGREEGRCEGRKTQWEICFDMLEAKLFDVDGITIEQRLDILMLMCNIEPE